MMLAKTIYSRIINNKVAVFLYFVLINLPLAISTFDATNWSDDYQLVNLLAIKAKFSSIVPLIFEPMGGDRGGGHFAPVYNLINYLFTLPTVNPVFFHLLIVLTYISTAFLIYLLVTTFYKDKGLGLLAGTLFAVNYYTAFKAFAWNCFHGPLTSTFLGVVSLYFLFRYLKFKRAKHLLFCACFLSLAIFDIESGLVFFPVLIITALFSGLKKEISFKRLILVLLILATVTALFPLGAYIRTEKFNPLSHRFQWKRSPQAYFFHANELFFKSTGLSILYNKLIFNKLKENPQLKETVIELVKQHKKLNLKDLPLKFIVTLSILGIFTILLFIFVMVVVFTRIRRQTYLFVAIYLCLFLIYLVIFYRTDVANAIAVPSSIIVADFIISFLRDKEKKYRMIGMGIVGLYLFATSWAIIDSFDDCYRKSFFGLSKVAIQGPDKIYTEINKRIGRFAKDGIILFTHDYRQYHRTGGFMRIGDMLGSGDLASLNATVYYQDLLKTDIPQEYKHKTFGEFSSLFRANPNHKKVIVSSKDEALRYLRENKIDTSRVEAIYIAEDYEVIELTKH